MRFPLAALLPAALLSLMPPPAAGQALASLAKPQIGSFGVDTAAGDPAVRPGDDFNLFASGAWMKEDRIPPDRARYGSFDRLREESEARTRAILEAAAASQAPAGAVERKIGDLYASWMDEARAEELGKAPIEPELDRIAAIRSREDVHAYLVDAANAGMTLPIGIGVWLDPKDPDRYVVSLSQSGLGMPDRDYYFSDDPRSAAVRAKYRDHIARLFELAGMGQAAPRAQAVFDLEKSIAAAHWTRAESRDRLRTYNPHTLEALEAAAPGFPWRRFLAATRLDARPLYVVRQPSAVAATAKIVAEAPLATLRDYFAFHLIAGAAPYLSRAFAQERFAFAERTLQGILEMPPRWRQAVNGVNQAMGESVGQIWVQRHFPPESRARMQALVANIKEAFGRRIDGLDWMGEQTKKEARAKLASFVTKVGYPDKWRDYTALEVRPGDLYGNMRRATAFAVNRSRSRLGGPTDRAEWSMGPQVVNAYYNSVFNEIVFPAAILQPPFFDPAADDAVNYGAIGAVIGHEIGHGFDDQGRRSDAKGVLRDWWAPDDDRRFRERSDRLVAQYSGYCPLPPKGCINGRQSLGENIGDLGGIQMAWEGYRLSLGGRPAPVIEGLTGDQRFFLAYAQIWRAQQREASLRNQLIAGVHSPSAYRVNGTVRNVDAWYAAFDVKPGDRLYLPPHERVRIW